MERLIILLFLCGCVMSCAENNPMDDPSLQNGTPIKLMVHDAAWTSDNTTDETALSYVGTGKMTLFYEKDKLYSSNIKAVQTSDKGVYEFLMPSEADGATRWWGIMPYSKTLLGLVENKKNVSMRLGPVQFPRQDSCDPQCDYLVAKPFYIADSKAEITGFKRMFAPLCLSITGLPEDSKIFTVTISLSQDYDENTALSGLYYTRLSEEYDEVLSIADVNSMGNAVSAVYGDGLQSKDGYWPVWLVVNPIIISSGCELNVCLSTQNRTYTQTVALSSGLVMSVEKTNQIDLNLAAPGSRACMSLSQDFSSQSLGGTKTLKASNGSSLEWITTTEREFNSSDDGGSAVKGAMMLNGTSFKFPYIEGQRIVGARIFTHPASCSSADQDAVLTVDGTDCYPFNLSNEIPSKSVAATGGVVEIGLPYGKSTLSGLEVSSTGCQHLISSITLLTEYATTESNPDDLTVDHTLFDLLDLNYAPLAEVNSLYQSGKYKKAADALLDYYKNRGITNPEVTLPVTINATIKKEAEDALPENKYRFAVHYGQYYEKYVDGLYTYYSFDDGNGGINWEYEMPDSGTECYQKHWHAWFTSFAKMYSYSNQEKWFNAWKDQYSDWLNTYPCPTEPNQYTRQFGYNTWHPLSMSTRLDYQTQLFEYFKGAKGFDFTWLTTFLKAFYQTVEYSRSHLYNNDSSNIRLAQYKSHCLAGILFPEFKKSPLWISEGSASLDDYYSKAFAADGCLIELDANYHSGVLMSFISVYKTALQNGAANYFSPDFVDRLYDACSFFVDYCYPNGQWETFNDTHQQTSNVTKGRMQTISDLFPEYNKFLYLSSGGLKGMKPTEVLCEYRTSGYYMFRSDWAAPGMMLIYKNNYNPKNMWHAHRDNGTIGLYKNGRIFLPDCGAYTYGDNSGGSLDQQRVEHQATRNHNTLTCELEDIPETNSIGTYRISYTQGDVSCVVAENNSYPGLTHRRTVWMVNKQFFVVADAAFGDSSDKTLNLSWHLCKDNVTINSDASGAYTSFSDGNNLFMKTFSEIKTGFFAQTGMSWCSENLGSRYERKFYRLNVKKESAASVPRFITVLYPCASPTSMNVSASFVGGFSQKGETVQVTVNGTTYDLSYSL